MFVLLELVVIISITYLLLEKSQQHEVTYRPGTENCRKAKRLLKMKSTKIEGKLKALKVS